MQTYVLHLIFVMSGFSALLYQIIWQRVFLVLYGSNNESVAMVVAAFMLGLGLGNLLGGGLSERLGKNSVRCFALFELLIGLYGSFSLVLFSWVGSYSAFAGTWLAGGLCFLLLLVPTLLMGATLPMLVTFRVLESGQVGRSVSWLYFVNTLGAALGCFVASKWLLFTFQMSGCVSLAAQLNLLSALVALCVFRIRSPQPST